MSAQSYTLGNCQFELHTDGDRLLGIGAVRIGGTLVRSGRLPIRPFTRSFTDYELADLRITQVAQTAGEIRITLAAFFRVLPIRMRRDHSFDPIHNTDDWDQYAPPGTGTLEIVLRPASKQVEGYSFLGFSYHYEYTSEMVPLFYLLDQASWELDGDITGASVISQSSCSSPTITFRPETEWTTEGRVFWETSDEARQEVMTHNLPRWASHQAFDFQYKGPATLLGTFARVDLIRSVVMREAGKRELKTFDKHIFDQTFAYSTSAKSMLLNTDAKSETTQKNLWTRIFDQVHAQARAEFGLREEPLIPKLCWNYWDNFTIDDYRTHLVPAAANLGFEAAFIDNVNKSDMSERTPHPDAYTNMCCGQEYEPSPNLGGTAALKAFIDDCQAHGGLRPYAWTNNGQSICSHLNFFFNETTKPWYLKMEDARTKYGGAYTNAFTIFSFKNTQARQYWVEALKKIKAETGLDAYLFDSFYNLGFMPIDYSDGVPKTHWRELLLAFKELQDAGINFMIESFGPFGSPQHGCPVDYLRPENLFACYKVVGAFGYTTIPTGEMAQVDMSVLALYRYFAHMVSPSFVLFHGDTRIDQLWTPRHKQVLADFTRNRPYMCRRYLQEDDQAVLWHDETGQRATVWNFVPRPVRLPGTVTNVTTGEVLPSAEVYQLDAGQCYAITDAALPKEICTVALEATRG